MTETTTETKNKHRNDLNDLYCWRCSTPVLKFSAITLIGDYICNLCMPCRNDWDEYIREHPVKVKLQEIEIRWSQLQDRTAHDGLDRTNELCGLMAEYRRTRAELFGVGREWVHKTAAA